MQPDPSLHDEQLETEINLVSELVLAASHSEERLPDQAIDDILGVGEDAGSDGAEGRSDGAEDPAAG